MTEITPNDFAFERLAGLDPIRVGVDRSLSDEVREQIFRAIPTPAMRRGRRRRRGAIATVIMLVLGGATAAAIQLTRPVTNATYVACYAGPTLHSRVGIVPLVGSPAATCQTLWNSGSLGRVPSTPAVVCVGPRGNSVVFPSRDSSLCAQLGIVSSSPSGAVVNERVSQLTSELGDAQFEGRCLSLARAGVIAHRDLTVNRLVGWRVVTIGRLTSAEPCAGFSVSQSTRQVRLIPEDRLPS